MSDVPRRGFVAGGAALVAGALLARSSRLAGAFSTKPGEVVIPWLDQPPENPIPQVVANQLVWEDLASWITPNEKFFSVAHYDRPVLDAKSWRLRIGGSVERPMTLTLADLKRRPREDVVFTVECFGNHGFPWFSGGIGNARWAGTPLAPILKQAGLSKSGVEVVFFGADSGEETVRDIKMRQNFARSMSVADAMNPANLLCYEMNGEPLPPANGFPLRLIAPGWYGIANVKWLTRIEVRETRFMNRFMARDYVTIREERQNGEPVWTETSVGRALLKSAPARIARVDDGYRIVGAAWGGAVTKVEVRIDDGPWTAARIDDSEAAPFAWRIWSVESIGLTAGEHTITSRAIDEQGRIQPAMDDPSIANKHTYWESSGQVTRRVRIA
jgi:DMSO/TMAO reductase YedYZ molybdopterin-dependent catalytic subunit